MPEPDSAEPSFELPNALNTWDFSAVQRLVDVVFEENETLEYWQNPLGLSPEDKLTLEHKMCSLANTQGGFIIFGIKEDRLTQAPYTLTSLEIKAFEDVPNLDIRLAKIIERTTPLVKFTLTKIPIPESKKILAIMHVHKSLDQPVECSEGTYYFRLQSASQRMPRSMIKGTFITSDAERMRYARLTFQLKRMLENIDREMKTGLMSRGTYPPFDVLDPTPLKQSIQENHNITGKPAFAEILGRLDTQFSGLEHWKHHLDFKLNMSANRIIDPDQYSIQCRDANQQVFYAVQNLLVSLLEFKRLLEQAQGETQ